MAEKFTNLAENQKKRWTPWSSQSLFFPSLDSVPAVCGIFSYKPTKPLDTSNNMIAIAFFPFNLWWIINFIIVVGGEQKHGSEYNINVLNPSKIMKYPPIHVFLNEMPCLML